MEGSCLCGVLRYEVDQLDMPISHCHCFTCQKAHAAPYVSTAGVAKAHFRWLTVLTELSEFESSVGKFRQFCRRCGTHLVAYREGASHLILRVATLDDAPEQRPESHIWVSHDRDFLSQDAPCYEEWVE